MIFFFILTIDPVSSFDEIIDDVVLYENYLICIFMDVNKAFKNEEKLVKNISISIGCKM